MTPPELDQLEALVKAMSSDSIERASEHTFECVTENDAGCTCGATAVLALVNAAPALIALAREHFFLLRKHVDLGESFWRSKEEAFRRHAKMHARAQVAEVALAKLGRAYAELQGDAACDVGVPA